MGFGSTRRAGSRQGALLRSHSFLKPDPENVPPPIGTDALVLLPLEREVGT